MRLTQTPRFERGERADDLHRRAEGTHPAADQPAEEQAKEEITEFSTSSQRVIIGRKMAEHEDAQATPAYLLKMEVGDRIGPTEVVVKIKRKHASKDEEETLEVDSVTGVVAGEDAFLGENVIFSWRTLADERYYLDTGGLDNIELGTAQ